MFELRIIYKNGKQIGLPEVYQYGLTSLQFYGILEKGRINTDMRLENGCLKEYGSDYVISIPCAADQARPVLDNEYDSTGKWVGYRKNTDDIRMETTPYHTISDILNQRPAALTTIYQLGLERFFFVPQKVIGYENKAASHFIAMVRQQEKS